MRAPISYTLVHMIVKPCGYSHCSCKGVLYWRCLTRVLYIAVMMSHVLAHQNDARLMV